MVDLNALLPHGSGWALHTAEAISDNGYIVGTGTHNGLTRGFLMQITNAPPNSQAGGDRVAPEGAAVAFDGTASADFEGDALTYSWNFGDGTTGAGPTPAHAFADDGTYTVTLTVRDAAGGVDTDTLEVTVANVAPHNVAISGPATAIPGATVSLAASATDPAGAKDTITYAWAVYKDGAATPFRSGTGPQVQFTPDGPGSYAVTVTASDEDGGSTPLATPHVVRVGGVLPGDATADGVVDFDDLIVLAKNYGRTGATPSQGDFDGNGTVDFDDLIILAKNYNRTLPAPAPTSAVANEPAAPPATTTSVLREDSDKAKSVFSTARVPSRPPRRPPRSRRGAGSRSLSINGAPGTEAQTNHPFHASKFLVPNRVPNGGPVDTVLLTGASC